MCTLAGPVVPALRETMKSRLIQMEEALFVASGQRFEAESEAAAEAAYLSNSGELSTCPPILDPEAPMMIDLKPNLISQGAQLLAAVCNVGDCVFACKHVGGNTPSCGIDS